MKHVLHCVELCAGGGGQAIGLHLAGFRHQALVEVDKDAIETLRFNGVRTGWWSESQVHQEPIESWTSNCKPDLLAAGIPCPPFSVAGKTLGDKDSRDLFPTLLGIVEKIQPRAVLVENVKGLLGPKFQSYRELIAKRLSGFGFTVMWELLNAEDYGVPQFRERSVLVAVEQGCEFVWPPKNTESPPTVGETIGGLMAEGGWPGAGEWAKRADRVAPTIVGGSRKHTGGADLGPSYAKRLWAELGVNGVSLSNGPPDPDHEGDPRLTVEMAAAIQSLPKDWVICGRSKISRYRQVGNAFPPPVAKAVGEQIAIALQK